MASGFKILGATSSVSSTAVVSLWGRKSNRKYYIAMLKNQNPTMITVPGATRDTFNQIAQATGKQQYEVVAEAAELLRKREERKQKGGSRA